MGRSRPVAGTPGSLSTAYRRDYGDLEGDEKREAALQDIREFLGEAKFEEVTLLVREERPGLERWRWLAGLAGVSGYPVDAWYEHVFPDGAPEVG